MYNTILGVVLVVFASLSAHAQFYTITKSVPQPVTEDYSRPYVADSLKVTVKEKTETSDSVSADTAEVKKEETRPLGKKRYGKTSSEKQHSAQAPAETSGLPELTISNLYDEIVRNGIKHPKIVLAQAILETGWFKSSVCRNKHNLFGLTNPRTKTYYEFNHWTESVRAYYTKVQYKFKGGNYFKWLRELPYAEEPGYTRALIKILKQI